MASCTMSCSPPTGGEIVVFSISRSESSINNDRCFRASCPRATQCRKPTAGFTVEMLVICSDLFPPSPNPLLDAAVGLHTQDIASVKLYASALAVVCEEIIYGPVNLMTLQEF